MADNLRACDIDETCAALPLTLALASWLPWEANSICSSNTELEGLDSDYIA